MKCLCRWNAINKKKLNFCLFAEGNERPSAKKGPLPRALAIALGKDFFGKILKISLSRARERALGKGFFKKKIKKNYFFAEGRPSANNFF